MDPLQVFQNVNPAYRWSTQITREHAGSLSAFNFFVPKVRHSNGEPENTLPEKTLLDHDS